MVIHLSQLRGHSPSHFVTVPSKRGPSLSKNLVEFRPKGRNKVQYHFSHGRVPGEKYFSPSLREVSPKVTEGVRILWLSYLDNHVSFFAPFNIRSAAGIPAALRFIYSFFSPANRDRASDSAASVASGSKIRSNSRADIVSCSNKYRAVRSRASMCSLRMLRHFS